MSDAERDRAIGALEGLALGDAYGMPTQSMSRAEILADYGSLSGLIDAGPRQRIAHGMPAGSITDDTEQALMVAELLIDGAGHVEPLALAQALRRWEDSMRRRGSLDLLGPSSKAAIDALTNGVDPSQTGRTGATNGAAMRVAPVGIAVPSDDPELLLSTVEATCKVTHNTGLAISGAVAIAAAVSSGIDGVPMDSSISAALVLADKAAGRGHWYAGAQIAAKTRWAREQVRPLSDDEFAGFLVAVIGTSVLSQESVVSALLIADRFADRPRAGLLMSASLGGDTDTVAAMAGAVLGAHVGAAALPRQDIDRVAVLAGLDLAALAGGLLALRATNSHDCSDRL